VFKSGATHALVRFPGGTDQPWYDVHNWERFEGGQAINVRVSPTHIPVYQRGGAIVPRKLRPRRSSALMHNDPYTLFVALDSQGRAAGTLYLDDGISYDYRNGKNLYVQFSYADKKLTGHQLKEPGYETQSWLERVVLVGLSADPGRATLRTPSGGEVDLETTFDATAKTLTVRKPGVNMAEDWEIAFH